MVDMETEAWSPTCPTTPATTIDPFSSANTKSDPDHDFPGQQNPSNPHSSTVTNGLNHAAQDQSISTLALPTKTSQCAANVALNVVEDLIVRSKASCLATDGSHTGDQRAQRVRQVRVTVRQGIRHIALCIREIFLSRRYRQWRVETESDAALTFMVQGPQPDINDPTWLWHNRLAWTIYGAKGASKVETKVDTCSPYSMIQAKLVKRLGLPTHPTLPEHHFDISGIGGRGERVFRFTTVELECPTIGMERVEVPLFIVRAEGIKGLLLGAPFITKFHLSPKLAAAMEQHGGNLPPGTSSRAGPSNIAAPVFDSRPKEIVRREEEVAHQLRNESAAAIQALLRAKGTSTSVSMPRTMSSRASTWASEGSALSVFSAGRSLASTATTVSNSSVQSAGDRLERRKSKLPSSRMKAFMNMRPRRLPAQQKSDH